MGAPTSEVGYTSATRPRGAHFVLVDIFVIWGGLGRGGYGVEKEEVEEEDLRGKKAGPNRRYKDAGCKRSVPLILESFGSIPLCFDDLLCISIMTA
jgi:hypothetical protein